MRTTQVTFALSSVPIVEDHINLMSIDVHSVMEKPERRQKFTRSKGYRSICVRCKWGLAYLTYDFNPILNFAVFVYLQQ